MGDGQQALPMNWVTDQGALSLSNSEFGPDPGALDLGHSELGP